jgi:hypothetical protein
LLATKGQATACHVLPADYPTDDAAEWGPMSKLRGSSKDAKEAVVHP